MKRKELLIVGLFCLSVIGLTSAAQANLVIRLEKEVPTRQIKGTPSEITFKLFESEVAASSITSQSFAEGEWWATYVYKAKFLTYPNKPKKGAGLIRFKADFTNTAALTLNIDLWMEIWLDGVMYGDREPVKQEAWALFSEESALADEATHATGADNAATANDADTLDGQHAAEFLGKTATAVDSDKLDGMDSSAFVSTGNDYGRSGVAADLYEGTTKLTDKYLGKTATAVDSDKLDGEHASAFAAAGHNHDSSCVSQALIQVPRANSINTLDSADGVGWYTSITIGPDGLPVISYLDVTNWDLKTVKCGNATCSSGNTITTVDSVGNVGLYTAIIIGSDGLPVISYFDDTNGDLKVAKCGNAACNSGNIISTVDSGGVVGWSTSIAIGLDGLPVISYRDVTNGNLKVAKCGNGACSLGNTITTVDSTADVGYYTSITIGADGLPLISYFDDTNNKLKLAKCGNVACSSGNIITTLIGGGDIGYYASIAIGNDGLPIFSFFDDVKDDLWVIKCKNAACTITTGDIVDSAGNVGQYISMTIGADGLPVISYQDVTNWDLKLVKCGDATCNTQWTGYSPNTITTVDSAGDVGWHTSITIGSDGLPIISYFDKTNWDLKVAKCGSIFCIPYWIRR